MTSTDLEGRIDHMLEALEIEVDAVRSRGTTRSIRVRRGRSLGAKAGRHTYSFELPKGTGPVEATSVAVVAGGLTQTGELLDVDDDKAVVSVPRSLGRTVGSAVLEIDAAAVLEATIAALSSLGGDDADFCMATVEGLLGLGDSETPKLTRVSGADLDRHQLAAVEGTAASELTFVWGPPGTGKTRTLGSLTAELCARGERVLLAAHAHVAVDAAVLACLAAGAERVARLGVPQLVEVPDEVVVERAADLEPAEGEGFVVATTLSRIATSGLAGPDGGELVFDHLLVDEGSMVQLPQLVVAAVRARRLTVFGDFRQLPPIVVSDAAIVRDWLGTDVFEVSGLTRTVERGESDERLFMLRRQYRAHPTVAAVCNRFAYGGRLESSSGTRDLTRLSGSPPLPGAPVVVWDTSAFGATALRPKSSRCNPTSAVLVASAAIRAARDHAALAGGERLVGITTPYAEQARLVRLLVEDSPWADGIEVATVHRFQGGERELMFVDLCDTRPLSPPPFLAGDEGIRLLNVAMSRARSKLVIVADLTWLTRGAVGEAIRIAAEEGESVSAEVWDGVEWSDVDAFLEQASADVRAAGDVLVRAPRLRDTVLAEAAVHAARKGDVRVVTDGDADPGTIDRLRRAGAEVAILSRVRERIVVADGVSWVGNTVSAAAQRSGLAMSRQESPGFALRLMRILGPDDAG